MNGIEKSIQFEVSEAAWKDAMRRAQQRIAHEYKRDVRLNEAERIEKIAVGYIGEFALLHIANICKVPLVYLGRKLQEGPDKGDFESLNGKIVDVKTQEVKYAPQADWRCEVTGGQKNRLADVYVFAKLFTTAHKKTIYLVGWMEKTAFFEQAVHRQPGTLLKNKPVHYDKWDLPISSLNTMQTLLKFLHHPENK